MLTLDDAQRISAAARAAALEHGWTMVIAVVADGGHLITLERMDGTQKGSVRVAEQKARTAILFKRPTKLLEDAVLKGRTVMMTLPDVVCLEGGVPLVRDGRVVAIAVTGDHRHASFPTVPTLAESGCPQATLTGWHGVFFPAGVPDEMVEKLSRLSRAIAQNPRMHASLSKDGLEPVADQDRAAFTKAYREELALWGQRIRELNIRVD